MVGRGLHEIVGWSFTDPALLDRLRSRTRPRAAPRRAAREPAVGGPVDHAPDAARLAARRRAPQRRAQRPRRGDLRVRHRLPGRARRRGHGPARASAPTNTTRLGALLSGALAPRSWRGERREADFFAAKALLGALLDRFHVDWSVSARRSGRSCTRAAAPPCSRSPSGAGERRGAAAVAPRTPARSPGPARRAAPARGAGAGTSRRTAAFAIDARQARGAGAAGRGVRGVRRRSRRCARTSRWRCPTSVSAAEAARRACAPPAARRSTEATVFDVYTGEQVGEGRRSLALALSFRDARAHAHRRGHRAGARADRRGARRARRRAAWLSQPEQQLRRGRPARARRRRDRLRRRARRAPAVAPSRLRAGRRDRALGAAAGACEDLYPRYRVPLEIEALDVDARCERIDAAVVAYPHAAAAPTVGALRERGVRVVDLSADFRLRSLPTYERWYGEHPAPGAARAGRLRADRASPRADRRLRRSSPTPAATRRRRCSRSRRSRARA